MRCCPDFHGIISSQNDVSTDRDEILSRQALFDKALRYSIQIAEQIAFWLTAVSIKIPNFYKYWLKHILQQYML